MFIKQAFKYQHDWWRYFIPIFCFLGLMALNSAAIYILNIDVAALMKSEIERKGSNRFFLENLIPFAIFLVGLFLWIKYVHKQPIKTVTTSRKKVDWGRIFFGFGLIVVTMLVITAIDYNSNPENYVLQFNLVPFLILAVITFIFIPLQTSFEEYLFRGYLMQGIGVLVKNRWVPLIITSVIFGSMHFMNPEVGKLGNIVMIYYIGTGFFLGIMTLMDEGMELALGFHAGNNLIASLLVTSDWAAFQTNAVLKDISEPSAGFDVIAPVLILYPIFLLIMAWRYKWRDWGGKLFGKVEEPIVLTEENNPNSTFIE